jgi:DNA-binding PadR family transcriptional regulator
VNVTRLFVLGVLDRLGPMHGHQIRREAQIDRTELWTEIKVGSLYAALHRLETEGLVEAVRTEQEGNLPVRTIYAITPEGLRELRVLREEALRAVRLAADPFDLALQYSTELDDEILGTMLEDRRHHLEGELRTAEHLLEQARPHINDIEHMIMRHRNARIETELRWHDTLIEELPKLLAQARATRPEPREEG